MTAAAKYERPEHRIAELSRQVEWLREEITRVNHAYPVLSQTRRIPASYGKRTE